MTPQFVSSARRRFAASAAPLAKGGNAVIGANCKSDANVCSVPGHQVGGTARPRDHAAPRERSCGRGRVVPSSTKQSTGAARAVSREPVDGDPSSESSHQRKSEAPPLHEPKGDAQLARVIGLAAYGAWIANFLSLPRPALNVSHETSDGRSLRHPRGKFVVAANVVFQAPCGNVSRETPGGATSARW